MGVKTVNCPADPWDSFDHWTLVTVHHSMPNCHVTTQKTIYQSRLSPKKQHLSAADLKSFKEAVTARATLLHFVPFRLLKLTDRLLIGNTI